MNGGRVLLLIDSLHPSREAAARAVDAARGGALFALAVLDREMLRPLHGKFSDVGFLGSDQTREILDALVADHRARAEAEIAEVAAAAREAGLPFEATVCEGDFVETTLAEVRARRADLLIVPGRKRSLLGRLVTESRLDALEARASCTFEYVG
jgi:nucleotide-binding universal stress UspA family protein